MAAQIENPSCDKLQALKKRYVIHGKIAHRYCEDTRLAEMQQEAPSVVDDKDDDREPVTAGDGFGR